MSITSRFLIQIYKSVSANRKLGIIGFGQRRFIRVLTCEEQESITNVVDNAKNQRFVALWGNGDYGRLGLGSLESKWRPAFVSLSAFGDGSLQEIACGGAHTLFLTGQKCLLEFIRLLLMIMESELIYGKLNKKSNIVT